MVTCHFALYASLENVTVNIANAFPENELAQQMDKKGRFIAELKCTKSWHYLHVAIEGATKLEAIGECIDMDLSNEKLEDCRGITTDRLFFAKYWDGNAQWRLKDIDHDISSHNPPKLMTVSIVQQLLDYSQSVENKPDRKPSTMIP